MLVCICISLKYATHVGTMYLKIKIERIGNVYLGHLISLLFDNTENNCCVPNLATYLGSFAVSYGKKFYNTGLRILPTDASHAKPCCLSSHCTPKILSYLATLFLIFVLFILSVSDDKLLLHLPTS